MIDQILKTENNRPSRDYYGKCKVNLDYPPNSQIKVSNKDFCSDVNFKLYKNLINQKQDEILKNESYFRRYMLNDKSKQNEFSPSYRVGNMIVENHRTPNLSSSSGRMVYNNYTNSYINNKDNPFSKYGNSYIAENSRNSTDITNPEYYAKNFDKNYASYQLAQKEFLKYNYDAFAKKNPLEMVRKQSYGKFDNLHDFEDEDNDDAQNNCNNLSYNGNNYYSNNYNPATYRDDVNRYLNELKAKKKLNYKNYFMNNTNINNNYYNENYQNNYNNNLYTLNNNTINHYDSSKNLVINRKRNKYDLGTTNLEHNIILNPISSYDFRQHLNKGRKNTFMNDDF